MNKRRKSRTKRRVNCELVAGKERHRGIAIDFSDRGLFVQTKAVMPPNRVIEVWFPPGKGRDAFSVRARVARGRKVPPQLMRVVTGGMGLEVLEAPPEFQRLVSGEPAPGRKERPAEPRAALGRADSRRSFQVRIKQAGGVRSRTVRVEAASETEAKALALEQAGGGWEITSVARV